MCTLPSDYATQKTPRAMEDQYSDFVLSVWLLKHPDHIVTTSLSDNVLTLYAKDSHQTVQKEDFINVQNKHDS